MDTIIKIDLKTSLDRAFKRSASWAGILVLLSILGIVFAYLTQTANWLIVFNRILISVVVSGFTFASYWTYIYGMLACEIVRNLANRN
jgi:membrane-bound ClpP family serine protease